MAFPQHNPLKKKKKKKLGHASIGRGGPFIRTSRHQDTVCREAPVSHGAELRRDLVIGIIKNEAF